MINELKNRLSIIDAKIEALSLERIDVRAQIAQLSTTLKVGDRVTYEGAKDVWELREIKPGYAVDRTPKFFGSKIKKDGSPGSVVGEIWQVPYGKELILTPVAQS